MTTVGIRLVEGLIARGIDTVFGIPGVHTIELYRGLAAAGFVDIDTRVTPQRLALTAWAKNPARS